MRRITNDVCGAFLDGRAWSGGNSSTDGSVLLLHGHRIAWKDGDGVVATLAGWPTVTTRERLNGLCTLLGRGRFYQDKGDQYFNGREIGDKEHVRIS